MIAEVGGYEAGLEWFDSVAEGEIVDLEYTVQVALRECERCVHDSLWVDAEGWRDDFITGVLDAMTEAKWVCIPRSAMKGAGE